MGLVNIEACSVHGLGQYRGLVNIEDWSVYRGLVSTWSWSVHGLGQYRGLVSI